MKRLFIAPALAFISLSLYACGSTNVQPSPSITNSLLSQDDQSKLRAFVDTLPEYARENVILIDPDQQKVIANKPELQQQGELLTNVGSDVFRTQSGRTVRFPDDTPRGAALSALTALPGVRVQGNQPPTCSDIGSGGPFYRLYSYPGYSVASATVTLPTSTNVRDFESTGQRGDTPYVYMGGFGQSTGYGFAVDAGMKHNAPSTSAGTSENWSAFMKIEGRASYVLYDETAGTPVSGQFRVNPGDQVLMQFQIGRADRSNPQQDNYVYLYVKNLATGASRTLGVSQGVTGYPASGTGVVLKRMVSIAQSGTSSTTPWYATGAYVKNTQWRTVQIGTQPSSLAAWEKAQTANACGLPAIGVSPYQNVVTVTRINGSFANEDVSITLPSQ